MKIKKVFFKHLLTLLLCLNILIPAVTVTGQPPSSTETDIPYSDTIDIVIEI